MVTKSKLKMVLLAEKGVDLKKLNLKKREKAARKKSLAKAAPVEQANQLIHHTSEDEENKYSDGESKNEEDQVTGSVQMDLTGIDESDSDSSADDNDQDNENDDEGIPVSDLEDLDDEEKEDLIPHQRLTINNTLALTAALKRIALPISKLLFSDHQSVTTSSPVSIPDVSDDLNRELAFYAQSLAAVKEARIKLKSEGVQFTRPKDYFAEMVKADEHMAKIKAKLIDEAASKKASAEARKQRDLKKFGKQVQVAKIQERDKERKQALEKIKMLKRKRQGAENESTNEADIFDVAIDNEIDSAKAPRKDRMGRQKRQKKDEKFGFGGKKKFNKSGDALSSGDLKGFSTKKMKGTPRARPGKARRASKR